ncbi:MAG: hypothetical protein K1Y36_28950 [Blastocatellia bacterium]|nr:hypothetical protein [Blastocatellia bacterium]
MTAVEGPSSEVITKKLEGTPDPQTGWRLIQSERDRFSVLMPSAVSLKEEEVRREPLQLFRYFYSSEKDECVVMVLRGFEKIGLGSQLTLQVLLDVMEREVKQEFEKKQATMTLVKNLQIGNYPGREYQVVLPNGLSRIRMFATPEAHYTIMVTKPNKEDLETLAEPFFRSFSLNGTTQ